MFLLHPHSRDADLRRPFSETSLTQRFRSQLTIQETDWDTLASCLSQYFRVPENDVPDIVEYLLETGLVFQYTDGRNRLEMISADFSS